jgi:hypothetical protein
VDVSETKRLNVLEGENAKLKRLLAEQMDAAARHGLLQENGGACRQAWSRYASESRFTPLGTLKTVENSSRR